ncbi:unnamed protein product [Pylaiella littoralis]
MSWAEGRAQAPTSGEIDGDVRKKEALDRVDGMLGVLAQDKLFQEDLRHTDVRKALEHWTGRNRLSEDDADELMEDNYRVQSVCARMAELQSLCRQASIGLPLSHVLAGKGLYEKLDQAEGGQAQASTPTNAGAQRGSVGAAHQTASSAPGSKNQENTVRNRKGTTNARGLHDTVTKPAGAGAGLGVESEEPSWRQALVEEVLRVTGVCVCALVFTLLLKYYRGDDPLGKGLAGQDGSSSGNDEL